MSPSFCYEPEGREPYQGFNERMQMNGWYWEPFGSVVYVYFQSGNMAVVVSGGQTAYKSYNELKHFLSDMGYEQEECTPWEPEPTQLTTPSEPQLQRLKRATECPYSGRPLPFERMPRSEE